MDAQSMDGGITIDIAADVANVVVTLGPDDEGALLAAAHEMIDRAWVLLGRGVPMKLTLCLAPSLLFSLTFVLSACGGGECEDQCSGDQIQRCVDGVLGDAEDCGGGMMCMTMDSGLQHCMLMGDDDDSSMDM